MLRGIGMSILLSWICLNSYAQLPHPNDTLENGKKVPFNQFLGRFSVFNELAGAGFFYSFNGSYSILKSDLFLLDLTVGANRIPYSFGSDSRNLDTYHFPLGLSAFLGRRRSRLNLRLGYKVRIYPTWYTDERGPYPNCGGVCATPPEHGFFLGLGYVFQHQYGFFTGIHAYGIMTLPFSQSAYDEVYYMPSAGLTFGYRLPSKQLHRQWCERGFKRRVLRLEQKEHYEPLDIDAIFYDDVPLETDSTELDEIQEELVKLKKRHERYLKEEQRLNGRSHAFVEAFGAAGFWSVNYSYTHPIGKSKVFAMDYRGGYGTDSVDMALPLALGVKAMKNYRGTGIFLGAEPRYNWRNGKVGLLYFLKNNVEFHFAYGLTGGVAFYLFFDPSHFLFETQFAPYGGLFLGYRLPRMKKPS